MGLEFAAPLALLGLPLAGLVWWLHRHGLPPQLVVAWLDPWRSASPARNRRGRRRRSDPRWWLRAAVLGALVIALAEPRLIGSRPQAVTLWVDGSLSMLAQRDGIDRLTAATRSVLTRALSEGVTTVHVRPLANPAAIRSVSLGSSDPGAAVLEEAVTAAGRSGALPRPPAPGLVPPGRHWLLTDGSDSGVNAWAARIGPEQVFQGQAVAAPNVQLQRLAVVRQDDGAMGRTDALVTLHNAGDAPVRREIELTSGGDVVGARTLVLPPGRSAHTVMAADVTAGRPLTASARPSDVLPEDDTLTVSTAPIAATGYTLEGRCDAGLVAALESHPGLAVSNAGILAIRCAASVPAADAGQLVWLHADEAWSPGQMDYRTAHWTPGAGDLGGVVLPAGLRARPVPAVRGDIPLLVADGDTLIVQRARGTVVVGLDAGRLADSAAFPALVAGLLDRAAGRGLLSPTAAASRPPAEADLAVTVVPVVRQVTAPDDQGSRLAPWLLALAAALLLLDAATGLRRPSVPSAGAVPS